MAQSAISSNRIEGVEIDQARVGTVVFGHPTLKDRDEEEVSGYRDALNLIHTSGPVLPVSEETILKLHKLSRGNVWDAGRYKDKPVDIIEKLPGGGERIQFRSVAPEKTPEFTRTLTNLWRDQSRDHDISPLIVMAAFNLDFLCIHPFRDGNGRVFRLRLLLTAYHLGIEVGRYISLERIIADSKARCYETLQESSQGWHEGTHDPWPYIGYVLFIIRKAYEEFEKRVGEISAPRGEKLEIVMNAIQRKSGSFALPEIEKDCPGVGRDWIRTILFQLKKEGKVACSGKGKAARWKQLDD